MPRRQWRRWPTGWRPTRPSARRSRKQGSSRSGVPSTCRTASGRRRPPSAPFYPFRVRKAERISKRGSAVSSAEMAAAAPEIPVLARNQAFETLYRRYVADVYHYSLALLRNPADAEVVTQTTFLNAYRAYQGGLQIEKPQNWLIKIAHNVARSRYARASRRVKEVPLEDHVEQLALPEADRPDVTAVLRALGRLPFNQRAALVMRELEGRSYAEIADTIGVSVSAVETLIFRARRSMRTKASAVRTLAAIPLPGSLSKLFGGGGMVAGGGAAAGGGGMLGVGLVVKTAVALVAGLVTAGVVTHGSGRSDGDVLRQRAPV